MQRSAVLGAGSASRGEPAGRAVALRAPAHGHRHADEHRRALPDRGRRRTSAPGVGDLAWTLVAGYGVNVFIVGLNQITDVEIDRINKPYLPIAAGDLTLDAGVADRGALAGVVPVVLALTQGAVEPVARARRSGGRRRRTRCRRCGSSASRRSASLCISGVRSVVVNLGVYAHFAGGDRRPGVGAHAVRAAVLVRDRDPQGRPRHRGRPALPASSRSRCASARGGCWRSGWARSSLAYVGMAVLGPAAARRRRPAGRAGRRATWRRWRSRCWRGARRRRPRRPRVVLRASTCACGSCSSLEYALMALACLAA